MNRQGNKHLRADGEDPEDEGGSEEHGGRVTADHTDEADDGSGRREKN